MTLGDHIVLTARSGLTEIDRDLDRAQSFIARYGGSPALDVWLEDLRADRAAHLAMMAGIDELRRQRHPALLAEIRPTRMLKAGLRSVHQGGAIAATGTDR